MSKATAERRSEVETLIRAHVLADGAGSWAAVQAQCPDIPKRTFFRWVSATRDRPCISTPPEEPGVPQSLPTLASCLGWLNDFGVLYADAQKLADHAYHQDGEHKGTIRNASQMEKAIRMRTQLIVQLHQVAQECFDWQRQIAAYDMIAEEVMTVDKPTAERILAKLTAIYELKH